MTGKTHQVLGIAAGLSWYLSANQPVYGPATLGTVLVGSHLLALLPDFDQSAAKFWSSIPYGKIAGKIADPFFKHRNISHSILGTIIVGLLLRKLLLLLPDYWGIDTAMAFWPLMISYASHLIIDMLTVDGVPLFFPIKISVGLPPKPFAGLRIMTGKWFENLVLFPLINIILILLLWSDWDKIKTILLK